MNHQVQRDYSNRDVKKQFRHAYVLKPNFNFSTLTPHCERIIYAAEGYGDHVDNIRDQLEESLSEFDENRDVLIPVGSAYINVLAGAILQKKISDKKPTKQVSFAMGIWSAETGYKFWTIYTDPEVESYEIIQ